MPEPINKNQDWDTLFRGAYEHNGFRISLFVNRHKETHELSLFIWRGQRFHIYTPQNYEKTAIAGAILRTLDDNQLSEISKLIASLKTGTRD